MMIGQWSDFWFWLVTVWHFGKVCKGMLVKKPYIRLVEV